MRAHRAAVGILVAMAAWAPAASAAPPTRQPADDSPVTGAFCPGSDVTIEPTGFREVFTAFSDGRGIITGTYKATLTNEDSGKTVEINASGPVFFPADGSAVVLRGRSLVFGEAGELGPESEASATLVSGVVTVTFGEEGVESVTTQGVATDMCAALA